MYTMVLGGEPHWGPLERLADELCGRGRTLRREDLLYMRRQVVPGYSGPLVTPIRKDGRMVKRVTAAEVTSEISSLLEDVAAGEEIEITKDGLVAARLIPAGGSCGLHRRFAGVAQTVVADDALFSTGPAWDIR